jgi:hypothetical protein
MAAFILPAKKEGVIALAEWRRVEINASFFSDPSFR